MSRKDAYFFVSLRRLVDFFSWEADLVLVG